MVAWTWAAREKRFGFPGRVGAIVAGRDQIFPNAAKPDMAERLEKHLSRGFSNPSSHHAARAF
jgi:hypothetical protein